MADVPLPAMAKNRRLNSVVIDRHEIAQEQLLSVTICPGHGRRPRRRWFTSRAVALAYAADRADDLSLLLVDLTAPADAVG